MSKPDWCPQDVWDKAVGLSDDCYVDFSPINGAILIARAILAAKAEEREACAMIARQAHGIDRRPENDLQIGAIAGGIAAAAAIRKRGEC